MRGKIQAGLSLLCLLSVAILGTIYLAWFVYPLEIDWLHLEAVVYMKKTDILVNFHVLMRYLTLPWVTKLAMPSFSSSAGGLHHFEQVKWLFHTAQAVCFVTLPVLLSFVKRIWTVGVEKVLVYRVLFMAAVPVLLGVLAGLIGFDAFFILFHQALFPGDSTWLFDPATDPVIYILPQEFFLHCFILFFALYEILLLGMAVLCQKKSKGV